MTKSENNILLEIQNTLGRIEGKLENHLDEAKQNHQEVNERIRRVEEETSENSGFRYKIWGFAIAISVISPGIYILIEKLIK